MTEEEYKGEPFIKAGEGLMVHFSGKLNYIATCDFDDEEELAMSILENCGSDILENVELELS
jgi:hypothetical protein